MVVNPIAKLAILIPAYKVRFLGAALESIQKQSARVPVWVFDDASPEGVMSICGRFGPDLRYHRFTENLGGHDLAAHWNRCVEAVQAEWIWLFSDDDLADPDSIETILEAIENHPAEDVLVLRSRTVDVDGVVVKTHASPPNFETAEEFLFARLRGVRESFIPDHVFRRTRWEEVGGFPTYPLAWYADDAFWLSMAKRNGIRAVDSGISWRKSGQNLSSFHAESAQSKFAALCRFDGWLAAEGWFDALERSGLSGPSGSSGLRRSWFWGAFVALGKPFPPSAWRTMGACIDRTFPDKGWRLVVSFLRCWIHRLIHRRT